MYSLITLRVLEPAPLAAITQTSLVLARLHAAFSLSSVLFTLYTLSPCSAVLPLKPKRGVQGAWLSC